MASFREETRDRTPWLGWRGWVLAWLLAVAGCRCTEPSCIDCYLAEAAYPLDNSATVMDQRNAVGEAGVGAAGDGQVPAVVAAQTQPPNAPPVGRQADPLQVPPEFPGADAPPLHLPPPRPSESTGQRRQAVRKLYSPLPNLAEFPPWAPALDGQPATLQTLQSLAMQHSPVLRQAAADVEDARGAMIQAGAYPNPEVGYESDTVNTANTNGYHGGYVQQSFVTAGKLRLARAAAEVDLQNAQLDLRKARVEVATAVRSSYFAAIVTREKLKLARALSLFTERIYEAQINLAAGGEAAPYEPMQLRVLALQARAAVVQAQQQYRSAWRQLAAAVGLPDLAPTELVGRPDAPVPVIDYDQALAVVLQTHPDLAAAANDVVQADYLVRLAEVTPIPNIDTYLAVQHDFTFQPGTTTYNLQVGGQLPVFNRNHGNIISAQARRYRAERTIDQVRNDLTSSLADAFARYEASRELIEAFRAEALRDQVRAYRGIYERYRNDPAGVQFNDVVVAQQTLAATLTQYISVLGDQWQAVVDVAQLMQVDDMFVLGDTTPVAPIPELIPVPEEDPDASESP